MEFINVLVAAAARSGVCTIWYGVLSKLRIEVSGVKVGADGKQANGVTNR